MRGLCAPFTRPTQQRARTAAFHPVLDVLHRLWDAVAVRCTTAQPPAHALRWLHRLWGACLALPASTASSQLPPSIESLTFVWLHTRSALGGTWGGDGAWDGAAAAMDAALGVQGVAAPPLLWRAVGKPPLVAQPALQQAASTLESIMSLLRYGWSVEPTMFPPFFSWQLYTDSIVV